MNLFPKRFLASKTFPFVLLLIALALSIPSLFTGWQQDDLVHRYYLLGYPDVSGNRLSPFELFNFSNGDSSRTHALIDAGLVPWWTLATVRLSFWRPLASLTHWLDYLLWPQSSVMMHLQNLFWFGALIVVTAFLYRRFLGTPWVAGLAALFFALDDAHGLPAGWIANRNALISAFFGVLALLVHDRWRRESWRAGVLLGPLLLAVALLSGESALAVCGYLFAYALFIDPASRGARALSLVPYALVAFAWLITYSLLGYGTWGSGFYVNPLSEPLAFLAAVVRKGPLLLADQWALPPSSIVVFLSEQVVSALWVWSLVVMTILAILLLPLIRHDRTAKFWVTGMLMAIPLVCSTMPHSRLLVFAGIGGFGLLAQWIAALWEGKEWEPRKRWWRIVARPMLPFFLFVHTFVAPVLFVFNSTSATFGEALVQKPAAGVAAGPEISSQDLVILNHPIVFYAHFFSTARLLAGQALPRHVRVLAPATRRLHLRRPDDRTLVIRPEGGYLGLPFDDVLRGPAHPLELGEQVVLTGMTAQVDEVMPDGRPAEVAFRFAVSLNDSSLRWLRWDNGNYAPFQPPAVGDSITVPSSHLGL
jgi:hypothetical protein